MVAGERMNASDKTEFLRIVNGMSALKPGKPITVEGLSMFWSAMQAWDIDDFRDAAGLLVRTKEFMPQPYDFEQLRKASRPTPGEAWAKVLAYVRTSYDRWDCGPKTLSGSAGPTPDDLAISRAVEALGGYAAIANSDVDKTHFLERRFAEHYEAMQDAEDVREAVPRIAGPSARAALAKPASALLPNITRQ
jgi:hypothetical protein